jgi:hypothetical protein
MKLLPQARVIVVAGLGVAAAGVAKIEPGGLERHRSSLMATVTMADGTIRSVSEMVSRSG